MAVVKKYPCLKCKASYKRPQALGIHMRTAHGVNGKNSHGNGKRTYVRKKKALPTVNFCPRCGCNLVAVGVAVEASL